jgi:hypothetical protein
MVWDIFCEMLTGCILWVMDGGRPWALVLVVLKLGMVTFGGYLLHHIRCSVSSIALHFLR